MSWALCLLWCHEQDLCMIPGLPGGLEYVCVDFWTSNSRFAIFVPLWSNACWKQKKEEGLFWLMASGEFCTIVTGKAWQWERCLGLLTSYKTRSRTETRSRHKLLSKLGLLIIAIKDHDQNSKLGRKAFIWLTLSLSKEIRTETQPFCSLGSWTESKGTTKLSNSIRLSLLPNWGCHVTSCITLQLLWCCHLDRLYPQTISQNKPLLPSLNHLSGILSQQQE